jgi:hypothetical protein
MSLSWLDEAFRGSNRMKQPRSGALDKCTLCEIGIELLLCTGKTIKATSTKCRNVSP